MNRLLSMRLCKYAGHLWLRIVMFRVLRFVELSTSQSAGPSKRFMMLLMMLLSVRLLSRKYVKTRLQDTPQTQNAPSGPRKFAQCPRRMPRSTLPSLDVLNSQEKFVLLQVVVSRKDLKSVLTKPRLLSRMPPRSSVLLSPSVPASM